MRSASPPRPTAEAVSAIVTCRPVTANDGEVPGDRSLESAASPAC